MERVTAVIDNNLQGSNLQAVLQGLKADMRTAAENLEFEEAARIRDEIKRLEAADLAISDNPMARQSEVELITTASTRPQARSSAGRAGMTKSRKRKPKVNKAIR